MKNTTYIRKNISAITLTITAVLMLTQLPLIHQTRAVCNPPEGESDPCEIEARISPTQPSPICVGENQTFTDETVTKHEITDNSWEGLVCAKSGSGESVSWSWNTPGTKKIKMTSTCKYGGTDTDYVSVDVIGTEVEAEDTSTTAGTRTSDETLVMVDSGVARDAKITLDVKGGSLPSSYPYWSGRGVTGQDGSLTANYSGTRDSTVNADTGLSGCSGNSVSIDIVDENKSGINWEFNQGELKAIQDKIKGALDKISGGDVNLSVNGTLIMEFKRVDMYNDGSTYGYFADISGTVYAEFPDVSISTPDVPVCGGLYVKLHGEVSESKISLTGSTSYDQSKKDEGSVGGSLTGSTTTSVGATASTGVDYVLQQSVSVTGSTTLSASGGIKLAGKDIKAAGEIAAKDFTATVEGDLKVLGGKIKLFEATHDFDCDVSKNVSTTIYTFN